MGEVKCRHIFYVPPHIHPHSVLFSADRPLSWRPVLSVPYRVHWSSITLPLPTPKSTNADSTVTESYGEKQPQISRVDCKRHIPLLIFTSKSKCQPFTHTNHLTISNVNMTLTLPKKSVTVTEFKRKNHFIVHRNLENYLYSLACTLENWTDVVNTASLTTG